jgi:hypothetical protein
MAKIVFRQEAVEALRTTAEQLGITMEEAANNAVLVYRDIIFNEKAKGVGSSFDDFLSSFDFGREIKRGQRQREILEEEKDMAFHRKHNRPYTPIDHR